MLTRHQPLQKVLRKMLPRKNVPKVVPKREKRVSPKVVPRRTMLMQQRKRQVKLLKLELKKRKFNTSQKLPRVQVVSWPVLPRLRQVVLPIRRKMERQLVRTVLKRQKVPKKVSLGQPPRKPKKRPVKPKRLRQKMPKLPMPML